MQSLASNAARLGRLGRLQISGKPSEILISLSRSGGFCVRYNCLFPTTYILCHFCPWLSCFCGNGRSEQACTLFFFPRHPDQFCMTNAYRSMKVLLSIACIYLRSISFDPFSTWVHSPVEYLGSRADPPRWISLSGSQLEQLRLRLLPTPPSANRRQHGWGSQPEEVRTF